jgi:hypothetical protein
MATLAVGWAPHAGSQTIFLGCPIWECLYEGTRGPGKTVALLADYAQHVGQGFGAKWRGVLFRKTYPQLADVVAKSKALFRVIFPTARFNESTYTWRFEDGEELLLRPMERADDYWNYHGHEYPWIGFEELTNWAADDCYEAMKACSRSTGAPGMPRKYRSTANPYGIGHHWVKAWFIDPSPAGKPVQDAAGNWRVRVHGHWSENHALLRDDPDYPARLAGDSNTNRRKAWFNGDWDVVAGGFFDDLWDERRHVLRPFPIPRSWYVDRSFDWGSSKPFSVGWWAESDGTEVEVAKGVTRTFPRGSLLHISEWYGCTGKANEGLRMRSSDIAAGIIAREGQMQPLRVNPGPADSSIFDVTDDGSIGDTMAACGVHWQRADKRPGSRANGWERMRELLGESAKDRPEAPGLWIFSSCRQWIRTVPLLPRDDRKPDDIDTDAEDHAGDMTRYRVLAVPRVATFSPFKPF